MLDILQTYKTVSFHISYEYHLIYWSSNKDFHLFLLTGESSMQWGAERSPTMHFITLNSRTNHEENSSHLTVEKGQLHATLLRFLYSSLYLSESKILSSLSIHINVHNQIYFPHEITKKDHLLLISKCSPMTKK